MLNMVKITWYDVLQHCKQTCAACKNYGTCACYNCRYNIVPNLENHYDNK